MLLNIFCVSSGYWDALLLSSGQDAAPGDYNYRSDVKGHYSLGCGRRPEAGQSHHSCRGEFSVMFVPSFPV